MEVWKNQIKERRKEYIKTVKYYFKETMTKISNEVIFNKKDDISKYFRQVYKKSYELMMHDQEKFRKSVLRDLMITNNIDEKDGFEKNVLDNYNELYELTKSDSQSNKSRSGIILELLVIDLLETFEYPHDNQKKIGKKKFAKDLGKQIDTIVPGIEEFKRNPSNCLLLSQKTTVRERWQEVGEEVSRTGANEAYLITFGEDLTENIIETAKEQRIHFVVPKNIKENKFNNKNTVYSFENFFKRRIKRTLQLLDNENN